MMEVKFLGAAGCITGSCHLLMANGKKILLDCGLFQGNDENKHDNSKFDFNPREIDSVILSHCHVDHSGRIPLLYKNGYKGKVYSTKPTIEITKYLLLDTAKILSEEVYFKNLERQKKGMEPLQEIYDEEDVETFIAGCTGCEYEEKFQVSEGIEVIFHDAGHVLGSAICEIIVRGDEGGTKKIIYSGDIGNVNKKLLKDPRKGLDCDYLIMECTYGNRVHVGEKDNYLKLLGIIKSTISRGGNVVIPCFSLGRTQEIIYMINRFVEGEIIENCRVYVDSPLASSITEVFKKYEKYYDDEANGLIAMGDNPLEFKGLCFIDGNEKISAEGIKNGSVIIASGGNTWGGRAGKHLRENIDRPESTIVITSYSGKRSIGSMLLKGYKIVDILGKKMRVKSSIQYIPGLSGHADKNGLLAWLRSFERKPDMVFLVHSEGKDLVSFKNQLENEEYNVRIVKYGDKIELNTVN